MKSWAEGCLRIGAEGMLRTAESRTGEKETRNPVITACYCPQGHNLVGDSVKFGPYFGIDIKLKTGEREGLLSLSPLIGDRRRKFFDFEPVGGEIVDVCCPSCSESLPIYDICTCGAYLVSLFSGPEADFANCIGICQRIGCLHSEIKSNRELRIFSKFRIF